MLLLYSEKLSKSKIFNEFTSKSELFNDIAVKWLFRFFNCYCIIFNGKIIKGEITMTIFKELTKSELTARIVKWIPEINPAYVFTVLSSESNSFDESDVAFWLNYFESLLYQ